MYNWKRWKIKAIGRDDFPKQLKEIRNCPKKLYYRGEWKEELFEKVVAVVGSRAMSRYGSEMVEKFMPELVANKISIVSGFMYGVDAKSHQECLNLGGVTVAVLGSGLDCLYPTENDRLYEEILEKNGLVISEYEPDFKPTLWSFPQRNRIVAGLANLGVLVVEAGMKSGSLITADMGKKMGRTILALPGAVTSTNSQGTNWLIKTGMARMATGPEDITQKPVNSREQMNLFSGDLDEMEKVMINKLKIEAMTMDELAKCTGIMVGELAAKLSIMSIKNLVEEENGKFYVIK